VLRIILEEEHHLPSILADDLVCLTYAFTHLLQWVGSRCRVGRLGQALRNYFDIDGQSSQA
jgi:hypothetical protein